MGCYDSDRCFGQTGKKNNCWGSRGSNHEKNTFNNNKIASYIVKAKWKPIAKLKFYCAITVEAISDYIVKVAVVFASLVKLIVLQPRPWKKSYNWYIKEPQCQESTLYKVIRRV